MAKRHWYKVTEVGEPLPGEPAEARDVTDEEMGIFLSEAAGEDWELDRILIAPSLVRTLQGDPATPADRVFSAIEFPSTHLTIQNAEKSCGRSTWTGLALQTVQRRQTIGGR